MDSFEFDKVKAEKASAMRRYNRLQSIAKLFRLLEICLALVFLSWISTRLPFAVKISGEYFRKLAVLIASPLFVFLLGNVIIVTLIFKSGRFCGENPTGDNAETGLYEEFIRNSGDRSKSQSENHSLSLETEDIEYQDKEIICEVNTTIPASDSEVYSGTYKEYRRTKSEILKRECSERVCGKLQRSETEKCRKIVSSIENPPENPCPEDKLSNEEFQRTIEAFIAKQLQFRRQESLAIVPQNQG